MRQAKVEKEILRAKGRHEDYFDVVFRGRIVRKRIRDPNGVLVSEWEVRSGRRHGYYRDFFHERTVYECFYRNNTQHGIAKQWHLDGTLLGTYRMQDGTGTDLWRHPDGSLNEQREYVAGKRSGVERFWNEGQPALYIERYWRNDELHGIEREWDSRGRLRRGFPRFFIKGKQVSKASYIEAWARSRSLPEYRDIDNRPERAYPKV